MRITPKISTEVSNCEYIKIIDTTVYTGNDPRNAFARAFFMEVDGFDEKRVNFNNIRSQQVYLPIIKDGIHKVYMGMAPAYEHGKYYIENSIVAANLYIFEDPGEPPIDSPVLDPGIYKFYRALEDTDEILSRTSDKWEELEESFDSLYYFGIGEDTGVAYAEEIVDCVKFGMKRLECRVHEISTISDVEYQTDIFTLKSYIMDEPIYSMVPLWAGGKAILNFNQIAPDDISNIYVVKLINVDDKTDIHYVVIYDLCRAYECMQKLILSLICKDCEGCTVSKEEAHRRFSLNRMIALMTSIMMSIHRSEFENYGEVNISDSRYESIKDASEKLEMYLQLILRCGECKDTFEDCETC